MWMRRVNAALHWALSLSWLSSALSCHQCMSHSFAMHCLCLHVAPHGDDCTAPCVRRDPTESSRVSTGISGRIAAGVWQSASLQKKKKNHVWLKSKVWIFLPQNQWVSCATTQKRNANEAPLQTIVEIRNSLKSPILCNIQWHCWCFLKNPYNQALAPETQFVTEVKQKIYICSSYVMIILRSEAALWTPGWEIETLRTTSHLSR